MYFPKIRLLIKIFIKCVNVFKGVEDLVGRLLKNIEIAYLGCSVFTFVRSWKNVANISHSLSTFWSANKKYRVHFLIVMIHAFNANNQM